MKRHRVAPLQQYSEKLSAGVSRHNVPAPGLPEKHDPASCRIMKRYGNCWTIAVLAGLMLTSSGCLMAATAPIRMERREKAEAAFARLAELTPEQIAGFLDNRMAAQLTLTNEQRPRISTLNLEHARRLHAIVASDDSVRAKGRAMKKQNETQEAALKEVLTAEQFTLFVKMKEEMRDSLKDFRSGK